MLRVGSAVERIGRNPLGNARPPALVSRKKPPKRGIRPTDRAPRAASGSRSMIRFVVNAYLVGIVLFFMLFALQTPNLPVRDAAVSALVWPYGVYKHFVI